MIGIIIVSHSEKAAEGVRDIAEEMKDESVKVIAAGGADGGRIGTNPLKIQEAIEAVRDKEGILLFVDLGSAVMSSEMAIEMLEEDVRKKVHIVNAPLVEGVVAATVQASTTRDIRSIIETAEESKNLRKV
ncbi:dihydroxyacetone kinase, phosphotransfer subunit [Natronincola peptidivorans]|uniref:phosphoenolpyruvate--glycerone phosphotransferase n=1 Tax=Natronincola peptidivorans TaxID=426128 RepID=A0A1I0G4Z4_9FIRM|nr:dihydroxyacetone kinase phosphoryl donor subunit DhaM [Natronincola peptidivorans]SET65671.1 dihydroxyacetone kinase, phosphotransfer subunit [Natronincola peptidivorans]